MLKIAVIAGSTRPNRKSLDVAEWVHEHASKRGDATYQVVDVDEYDLPLLDEPRPPSMERYEHEHTKQWSRVIDFYDGYVFVTPEYNHGIPAALKNAIDFVYTEWNNKAAGFVSYGSTGGGRAVEHLRGVLAEVQIADVRGHVLLSIHDHFEDGKFKPTDLHAKKLSGMLDQLVDWSRALKTLREEKRKQAEAA